jgi:hypothetical protein
MTQLIGQRSLFGCFRDGPVKSAGEPTAIQVTLERPRVITAVSALVSAGDGPVELSLMMRCSRSAALSPDLSREFARVHQGATFFTDAGQSNGTRVIGSHCPGTGSCVALPSRSKRKSCQPEISISAVRPVRICSSQPSRKCQTRHGEIGGCQR